MAAERAKASRLEKVLGWEWPLPQQQAIPLQPALLIGPATLDGSTITIQPGPATLAACPPEGMGDQFVADVPWR